MHCGDDIMKRIKERLHMTNTTDKTMIQLDKLINDLDRYIDSFSNIPEKFSDTLEEKEQLLILAKSIKILLMNKAT